MPAHSLHVSRLKPEQRRELEDRLYARQNGVCFICEDPIDLELQRKALEIDHIIPIAAEGKDDENNFALVHESCNRRKSASNLEVARILCKFYRIETEANAEPERAGQGANLGHVLKAFGGAEEALHMVIDKKTVRYSISDGSGAPITTLPVWNDNLSLMEYCFARIPIKYLHHDERINPRSIGTNIRGLIEEFHKGNPQLHVALAWWNPSLGDEKIHVFDGQHKAAAQILLGSRNLPVRIFLNPDTNVLLDANTNAGDNRPLVGGLRTNDPRSA
jgi:HNH endonuclease